MFNNKKKNTGKLYFLTFKSTNTRYNYLIKTIIQVENKVFYQLLIVCTIHTKKITHIVKLMHYRTAQNPKKLY